MCLPNICQLGSTTNRRFTIALKVQEKNKPGCTMMVTQAFKRMTRVPCTIFLLHIVSSLSTDAAKLTNSIIVSVWFFENELTVDQSYKRIKHKHSV
uniref:Uncharacterized protein n=1 Tax=Rhipicephalus zambeziensis TaxID=60191 RepID=A0A224YCB4_9ACAR